MKFSIWHFLSENSILFFVLLNYYIYNIIVLYMAQENNVDRFRQNLTVLPWTASGILLNLFCNSI